MDEVNECPTLCVMGTLNTDAHHAHTETPFCYPDVEAFKGEASLLSYRI
jgi:hypothetical protein